MKKIVRKHLLKLCGMLLLCLTLNATIFSGATASLLSNITSETTLDEIPTTSDDAPPIDKSVSR